MFGSVRLFGKVTKMAKTTFRIETTCPFCETVQPLQTALDGTPKQPRGKDLALCFSCGGIGVYEMNPLRLRKPTEAETASMMTDPLIARLIRAHAAVTKDVTGSH